MANTGLTETAALETEQDLAEPEVPLTEEVLVEEVSIDGMCGVY